MSVKLSITKVLVANRGEIAIRVLRAATELGLRTVALYTYEDRYSLHRYKADEAYLIGPETEALKPYLDIDEIIAVAKKTGVDAIHPGYGFLSENLEFARRCASEGITFIGPAPEAMEMLGDKVAAKKVARSLKIPVIEDSTKELSDEQIALAEARRIGFPVLVKAAAGGGGRGMRVVRSEADLTTAFLEARREAERAFGDPTIFIEKYIDNPKHIEVQILGDSKGSIVHLFERDCSVQRRFQKVVEYGPSVSLSQETRAALYEYALKIARKVSYQNAGTVEFLVDTEENIYFIEVNPRIQVEHTVTEEVTGIDLVRAQLCIAGGALLSDPIIDIQGQHSVEIKCFAIQCRVTTEDPRNDFTPAYGQLTAYRSPGGFGIRLDAGSAYAGAVISPFFDSLLVKITARGRSLEDAAERLARALKEFRIRGLRTNLPFLLNVIEHPVFRSGDSRVSFLPDHPELFQFQQGRDRATKACTFIADVVVNGNPDVRGKHFPDRIIKPVIPAFSRNTAIPDGSKQRLEQLGREKFLNWLKNEKSIQFTDTTLRDAHQSLLATRVRTTDMLAVAESFSRNHPEVFSLEVWGGATFDVAMRFLHECPWKRLIELRKAIPNILLQMLFRGSNAVGYSAYPDNLIERFIIESATAGIDIFRIFDSMNWLPAMEFSIKTVNEKTEALAEACICFTGDFTSSKETKYTLQYYRDLARRLEDAGAHILAIKDMAGLLKPYAASELIPALQQTVSIPIHLHSHDTSGIQAATYLKAIEAGVDIVDVALASMSGLTSQPNFNSLVAILEGTERAPTINLDSLNQFSDYWEVIREQYCPFESGLRAGTGQVYEHEIPGGQYSNLKPQARALGLEQQFPLVKKNYVLVNRMLGNLVKVTPSSKVVGDMALFMTSNSITEADIFEKGSTLSFPSSLKSFFRGELGQAVGGFPEELQKIVLGDEKPFTSRPNDQLAPIDFESEFPAFQNEFGKDVTILEFLSFKLYPKVFRDFREHLRRYGSVAAMPTPVFFYGMQPGQEIMVDLEPGKRLIIKLIYVGEPDSEGNRVVSFELNGQSRNVEIRDQSIQVVTKKNIKASAAGEVGSPLQGKLGDILVSTGSKVSRGTPLFIIEAMKMETTVPAPEEGIVSHIELSAGTLIEQDDLVLTIQKNS